VGSTADSTVILAEFAALRGEIASRTTIQAGLLTINITAAGTLAGFYLNNQQSGGSLLLIMPFISSALGLAWIDHARTITSIGMYIGQSLWPHLRKLGDMNIPCREDDVRLSEKKIRNMLLVIGPPCATFVVPSVLALSVSAWTLNSAGTISLWSLGAVVTVGNAALFLVSMKSPTLAALLYRRRSQFATASEPRVL
jgi:hypothetical protein